MSAPKDLYDVARMVCHEVGFPWRDPRTGVVHKPPVAKRGKKKRIRK